MPKPKEVDVEITKMDAELAEMEAQLHAMSGDQPSVDASPAPADEPIVEVPPVEPTPEPMPTPVVVPPVQPPQPGMLSRLGTAKREPKAAEPDDKPNWEHKYRSEVGKLDGWVRERDAKLAERAQELDVASRRIAELEARVTGPLTPDEFMGRYGFDDEDVDLLGGAETANRFHHMATRAAGMATEAQRQKYEAKVSALETRVAQIVADRDQEALEWFRQQTLRDHPELDSQEFLGWLKQQPSREDRFEQVFLAGDTEAMLADYARFQTGPVGPPSLESQAMPGQSATPSSLEVDPKPKQYTIADVERLNDEWNRTWRFLTPEQQAALSAELDRAELSMIRGYVPS